MYNYNINIQTILNWLNIHTLDNLLRVMSDLKKTTTSTNLKINIDSLKHFYAFDKTYHEIC